MTGPPAGPPAGPVTIASVHIYPMKAGRAVDLDQSVVEPWGLAGTDSAGADSAGAIRVGDVVEVLGP